MNMALLLQFAQAIVTDIRYTSGQEEGTGMIAACPRCHTLYNGSELEVCSRCQADEKADFRAIQLYLDECPGANALEVAEATGVKIDHIDRMIRRGVLEIVRRTCETCGAPVKRGRFCPSCAERLQQDLDVLKQEFADPHAAYHAER